MNLIELNKAQKLKMLFLTEDGFEIFEGDEYWYLGDTNHVWPLKNKATTTSGGLKTYVYFSTKEAAEKYIQENKPKPSIKELDKALEKVLITLGILAILKLKKELDI